MSMMGELTYFLGLQIKKDDKGISICQEQYTRNLLKKYEISDSSSVKTPMVPPNNLGPDVVINQYQASPKESHLIAVKRIFKYHKGTSSLGLWYPKCSRFDFKGYSDSNYAGRNMDKKGPKVPVNFLEGNYQANPKESHLIAVKRIFKYHKGTSSLGLWYPKCSRFDFKGYSDSNYAGRNMDKKGPKVPVNFLEGNWEFWCTAIAFDSNLSANDSKVRPLKEYKIKFTMMNGKKPLTLNFKTFCKATGLDYNKGTYGKPTDAKDPEGNIQPTGMRLHSTLLDEGTSKSKHFLEDKTADPKALEGNKQPTDMGLPSTVPDESIGKPKPLSEGPNEDNGSENLTQSTRFEVSVPNQHQGETSVGMEPDKTFKDDVLKAREEMDEDIQEPVTKETQTHHSIETSNEEPLSQEHQSPLPNRDQHESCHAKKTDESESTSSCSETLKPFDNYIPITKRQLVSSLRNFFKILFAQVAEDN
nr:hypothetical protein [Tanacetum cinerariifolium]